MKEYKLLKYYPSLPIEWDEDFLPDMKDVGFPIIVVEREDGYYLHPSLKDWTRETNGLPKTEIEGSNGYWEEVVPRKAILTTEDGKGIFEGDEYWYVDKNTLEIFYIDEACFDIDEKLENYADFSKKGMVETYVKFSRPLFSANEIEELFKKHSKNRIDSSVLLEVRKMVKEKLDGNK
jgi:hypothetical protein